MSRKILFFFLTAVISFTLCAETAVVKRSIVAAELFESDKYITRAEAVELVLINALAADHLYELL